MALAWKKRLRTWELETEVTRLSSEAAIQQRSKEAAEAKPTSERKADTRTANAGLLPSACPSFLPTAAQPACNYLIIFQILKIHNYFKY
jgi:hypothetical protein